MHSRPHRTLTQGHILALSRQGKRWWPHNDSPAFANTFREAERPTALRFSNIPTVIVLPLAAASVATLVSNHYLHAAARNTTYLVQAPIQTAVTSPVNAYAQEATILEPIADRDRKATEFTIPFAVPYVPESKSHQEMPPGVAELADRLDATIESVISESDSLPPTSIEETFADPFHDLSLAQEQIEDQGPDSGLLPDLDDPIAEADPEIFSVKEIVDTPRSSRDLSKLARYQEEFPEIFTVSSSGSSSRKALPSYSPAALADRRVREAVQRAKHWRSEERSQLKNERRPRSLLGSVKRWLNNKS